MLANLIDRYKAFRLGMRTENSDPVLNRVYLALYQLQRSHSFIEIMVEGNEIAYQSIILSLDPVQRNILIDELFPVGFIGLPGQKVLVSVRQKAGRKLKFHSVILERHSQNDVPLYVIEMPISLDIDQRRSAYRLPISSKLAIESSFTSPDFQTCKARLRNVSSTGVCLEIESESIEQFQYDDHLTSVAFDFAGMNIDCELAVRSMEAANNDNSAIKDNHWVIGAEFVDLPQQEQRVLEKSIMRIQRDRIKFSGDMEMQQAIA